MEAAQCYPSNRDDHSTEPAGYAGLTLSLDLTKFPEAARRIGLVLAEVEEGLSGAPADAFADEFRDRQLRSYQSCVDLMDAIGGKAAPETE
jgi:hypothetical protein